MSHVRSIAPLLKRVVAFLRKFRRTHTEEQEIALTRVFDALRYVFGNGHNLPRADRKRVVIADCHQASAGLDDIDLVDRKGVQLSRDAWLHAGPRDRELRPGLVVDELGDVAPFDHPDFGFRFLLHLKDNTSIRIPEHRMNDITNRSVQELLDLAGETVLVTGASGNIGQGIALRLAEAGATIIVHYHRNESAAEQLASRLGGATVVQADLADEAAVDAMYAQARPTMVVNNAAAQPIKGLDELSYDEWRAMMAANLDGAFLVTQRAARAWAGSGGAIVNIASIEALDPAVGHGHYATSKAGLVMLSRAAALELGSAGIRVNCVSPGLIDRDGLTEDWPDGVERWHDRAPLGRLGTPKDVADAVLFLLSPAARWISGTNLVVDGGMSAQSKW